MDFAALNSVVTIPSGSPILFQRCVVFSVLGDDQSEGNETFRIVFSPQFGDFFLNGEDTVTVTIQEDGDSMYHKCWIFLQIKICENHENFFNLKISKPYGVLGASLFHSI